jgi:hypothetical protein
MAESTIKRNKRPRNADIGSISAEFLADTSA